jgi:hypothetical protein
MSMDHGQAGSWAPWTGLIALRGHPNMSHWLWFGWPQRTGERKGGSRSSNNDGVARVWLVSATAHQRSSSVSREIEAKVTSLGEHSPKSGRRRGSGVMMIAGGRQRSSVRWRFEVRLLASDGRGGREKVGDLILAFTGWRVAVELAGVGVEGRRRVEFIEAAL